MTPDETLGLPEGYLEGGLNTPAETLFIPKHTAGWISSNHREHWAVRARKTKLWRNLGYFTARQHKLAHYEKVRIVAYIHKTTARRYDAHNLTPTMKAIIDGLVQANLIDDDNNKHLVGPDMRAGEKRKLPGITIHIYNIGETA